MSVIKIDIEKASQEFEITGKTYTMYWNDDAIYEYLDFAKEHEAMAEKIDKTNVMELDKRSRDVLRGEQLDLMEGFIDKMFGTGSFDSIYEDTGRSMMNLNKIIEAIIDFLTDKASETKKQKRKKYTKK